MHNKYVNLSQTVNWPPFSAQVDRVDTLQLSRLSNARTLFHPYILAVYAVLLALLVNWSGVLRTRDWGRLILFTASLTAGFILGVEWMNRSYFEAKTTEIVKSESLSNIQKFFGKDQCLVATLGEDEVIGVVGLRIDGKTATVQHWDVKAKYRNRGLGWDLLEMVIERSQGTKKNAFRRVQCETYNLQNRAEKSLRDHGFQRSGDLVKEPGPVGWFGVGKRTWVKML